ncbi:hypothetical protein DL769_004252 [Monosporascus sp. CRB-8-3]|nr:hypothetical protein DL769_004252 [Monosporascus sp. CRB-8-3]
MGGAQPEPVGFSSKYYQKVVEGSGEVYVLLVAVTVKDDADELVVVDADANADMLAVEDVPTTDEVAVIDDKLPVDDALLIKDALAVDDAVSVDELLVVDGLPAVDGLSTTPRTNFEDAVEPSPLLLVAETGPHRRFSFTEPPSASS